MFFRFMKKDIGRQELIVECIWNFIEQNDHNEHDIENVSRNTSASSKAVGELLEQIMNTFGYQVLEVQ